MPFGHGHGQCTFPGKQLYVFDLSDHVSQLKDSASQGIASFLGEVSMAGNTGIANGVERHPRFIF